MSAALDLDEFWVVASESPTRAGRFAYTLHLHGASPKASTFRYPSAEAARAAGERALEPWLDSMEAVV